MTEGLYIGLISGTSADGVDTALVDAGPDNRVSVVATLKHPYPTELQERLHTLVYGAPPDELRLSMELDHALGDFFAACCLDLILEAEVNADDILAIGSHGQTLRHYPDGDYPATLQVGDPARIALGTGIPVVADFRRADMAVGGQGAPLMPAFHADGACRPAKKYSRGQRGRYRECIHHKEGRTHRRFRYRPGQHADGPVDTPASAAWRSMMAVSGQVGGQVDQEMLDTLLADEWFGRPAPKSTGQEYFNLDWLQRQHSGDLDKLDPQNVQATLLALTSQSITAAIDRYLPGVDEIVVCGGGAHNAALMASLATDNPGGRVTTSVDYGIDPDWVEAAGFAWLARRRLAGLPGNAPAVTGAAREVVLGGLWLA